MRNFTKLFALAVVMMGFTLNSNAQNTATSAATTASATIVAPITITQGSDMSFGQVVAGATLGTVELSSAGVRTESGGVTFSGVTGSPTASSFTVTGETGYTYTVTLPSSDVTLTGASGAALGGGTPATMTVNAFTKSIGTGDLADDGTETFTVGATLNVGANQLTGGYEGTYTVKVDYN